MDFNNQKPTMAQITDMASEIYSNIEHGECVYTEDGLMELFDQIDKLKKTAVVFYGNARIDNNTEGLEEEILTLFSKMDDLKDETLAFFKRNMTRNT